MIDPAGVTGGARWHDYQMHNADRMTLSFVLSAAGARRGNRQLRRGHRRSSETTVGSPAWRVATR